jgi:hypothetical protein
MKTAFYLSGVTLAALFAGTAVAGSSLLQPSPRAGEPSKNSLTSALVLGVKTGEKGFMESYGDDSEDNDPNFFACPHGASVTLMWTAKRAAEGTTYNLRVAEMRAKQTRESALKGASTIRGVKGDSYVLKEASAAKPGTAYVWQVEMINHGRVVETSPAYGIVISNVTDYASQATDTHRRSTRIVHTRKQTRWYGK